MNSSRLILQEILKRLNWRKRSALEKVGIVYLSALLVFLVAGSISRLFMPWNCDQAKELAYKAQTEQAKNWSRIERGKLSAPAGGVAILDGESEIQKADRKVAELCR